jgi:glycine amidinotransferase
MSEESAAMENPIPFSSSTSPVNSYNEWDPLEEVIVGHLEGATVPTRHVTIVGGLPAYMKALYRLRAGRSYPGFLLRAAQQELNELLQILKGEGISVRRPETVDFRTKVKTPRWSSTGYCATCPRDGVLIIGEQIIEAAMSWPSRQFEMLAYRSLFKEYSQKGALWISAPRPALTRELFNYNYPARNGDGQSRSYVVSEFEPVFDAADFARCGYDLFVIRSNTTNRSGINWLKAYLGEPFRIHEVEITNQHPMHIDSTVVPLAAGRIIVNPDYVDSERLPRLLRSWEILTPPQPDPVSSRFLNKFSVCSKWISLNVLVLDEKKVIVEGHQRSMIKALKDWGFEPIPCPFETYSAFGGGIHCATLDVRRRGKPES